MKSLIILAVAMVGFNAFAKTDARCAHINTKPGYETAYVIGLGEVGDAGTCVTYKVAKASKPSQAQAEVCGNGELYPCTPKKSGIPTFLQKLQDAANKLGLQPQEEDYDFAPGGN